jgi:hypothetical protein
MTDNVHMTYVLVILFILAIGPLAVRYGADSRLDDRRL